MDIALVYEIYFESPLIVCFMSQLSNSSFLITFELESLLQFTGDLESLFSVCPDSIGRIAVFLLLCILKILQKLEIVF